MVAIAPGKFQMGCVSGILCSYNEPVHLVDVQRPFALSVYEITKGQFLQFVERTGYVPDSERHGCIGVLLEDFREHFPFDRRGPEVHTSLTWKNPGHPQSEDHPVVCVTWSDATSYVGWLSSETGKPYRLPSESEWEYAARSRRYTDLDPSDYCERRRNSRRAIDDCLGEPLTMPVGSEGPNEFGLFDMERNAYEWVEDCWNTTFLGAPQNGDAWLTGACEKRVLRGGDWGRYAVDHEARGIQPTDNPNIAHDQIGFRVAQSPTQ